MLAALAATYWARTPRQQAPFLFVASVEVVIAVTWGFGPGTVSALIAVAGMRVLFGEPLYSLIVFFSVSALVGIVSERRKRGDVTLNRQALIFANLTEAIIITDLSRRILDVNPAAEMMFGYTKDDLIGVSVAVLQKGEEVAARGEIVNRALAERGFWKDEVVFVRKDGSEGVCETTVVGIRDVRGKLIARAGINRDITERKDLEQKLLQARKMEAVGRLAGGVAHDFNNLLTAILGYSELLLNQIHDPGPARTMIVEIEKAGKRAASLTGKLLAFSSKQILQPQVLDLKQVVSELEPLLRKLVGDDITLHIGFSGGLARVRADRDQIEQVLMNLVVNARDAMPGAGGITIETANPDESYSVSPDQAGQASQHPAGFVRLIVADTGTGMDEGTKSQIFEPFFTTKPLGKGTGLGLSTVYGIVKQSGGEIKVTSALGEGSTFEILLPAAGAESTVGSVEVAASTSKQAKTILVIEDEGAVRRLVTDILSQAGYEVLEASGGQEALALSREFVGEIDLVVSDVVMPTMNGPQVAEELARVRPGIRVMFMSGYTEDSVIPQGPLDARAPFILKPFTPDEFAEKVREALAETARG